MGERFGRRNQGRADFQEAGPWGPQLSLAWRGGDSPGDIFVKTPHCAMVDKCLSQEPCLLCWASPYTNLPRTLLSSASLHPAPSGTLGLLIPSLLGSEGAQGPKGWHRSCRPHPPSPHQTVLTLREACQPSLYREMKHCLTPRRNHRREKHAILQQLGLGFSLHLTAECLC